MLAENVNHMPTFSWRRPQINVVFLGPSKINYQLNVLLGLYGIFFYNGISLSFLSYSNDKKNVSKLTNVV